MSGYREPRAAAPNRVGGVLVSAIIAGPLVLIEAVVTPFFIILLTSPGALRGPWDLGTLFWGLLLAMVVGFLPGLIASLIGTAFMGALTEDSAFARRSSAWMLAGFVLALPVAILVPGVPPLAAIPLFGVAGSICGYVCWRFEHLSPLP
ncbi:hypothetical protein GCM10022281_25060 [Sphingomonas rosea]|uniref:Uncharacterized protein n=1 Tax=Sphingomonas rosea TaxID=335605 RepID=A0ABP7UIM8_9SPHN